MATIIRIKRSTGTAAPTSLKTGELAYSEGFTNVQTNTSTGGRLYYGAGGTGDAVSVLTVGGQYYTELLSATLGTLTANRAVLVDGNSKINEFNVDDLTLDGSGITVTASNTALTLSPNGTATVNVPAGYKDRTGFGTNSLATKEYVDTVVTAQDLDFQTDSSVALSIDLDTETLTILGGTSIGTRSSGNTITIDLDPSGVTAGSYGSATQIPVLAVNAQGQITSATTASLATTLNLAGDGATTGDVALLDSSLEIAGGTNITTTVSNNTVTVALDDSATINGSLTVDNIKIDGNTIYTPGASTLYLDPHPIGDSGDVVILGNLTVQGTTTTVNSTVVSLNDLNLVLADSAQNAGEADGAGLTVNGANATITYDAATDRWDFNKDIEVLNVYANVTGNIDADSGDIRTLTGNIATINTITTEDLTADSAEIGNLTGTTAQFDTSVTTATVNATTVDTTNLEADSASILGDIRITGSFIDITTDELTEGSSNLYYTTSRVDSDMGDILVAGEGIDITDGTSTYTISGEDATLTNKGIASFGGYADSAGAPSPGDSRQFELTGGDVRIAVIDGGTY